MSQKSATVAENGETTAKFGDCRTFLRQSLFSATNCRTFQCGQGLIGRLYEAIVAGAIVAPTDRADRLRRRSPRVNDTLAFQAQMRHLGLIRSHNHICPLFVAFSDPQFFSQGIANDCRQASKRR